MVGKAPAPCWRSAWHSRAWPYTCRGVHCSSSSSRCSSSSSSNWHSMARPARAGGCISTAACQPGVSAALQLLTRLVQPSCWLLPGKGSLPCFLPPQGPLPSQLPCFLPPQGPLPGVVATPAPSFVLSSPAGSPSRGRGRLRPLAGVQGQPGAGGATGGRLLVPGGVQAGEAGGRSR